MSYGIAQIGMYYDKNIGNFSLDLSPDLSPGLSETRFIKPIFESGTLIQEIRHRPCHLFGFFFRKKMTTILYFNHFMPGNSIR